MSAPNRYSSVKRAAEDELLPASDRRGGGEVYADGELVWKDGAFLGEAGSEQVALAGARG